MPFIELILILLATTAALEVVARRLGVPLPALLVGAGVALALLPGLPRPALDPEAVFIAFVPPLLYWAAMQSSLRDLRRYAFTIGLLAVGLVLATALAVAAVAHALLPELTWPAALVLGAIVAPPDVVAAVAVTRRLRLPRQVLAVLEGESLVNDATALVACEAAVGAAVSGSAFSPGAAALHLVVAAVGGVAVGLLTGAIVRRLRRVLGGAPVVDATLSLLLPFLAFLPAQRLGVSGVLAVVAVGLYAGQVGPREVSAPSRLQAAYLWRTVSFLLEGLIFLLVGLGLPLAFAGIGDHTFAELLFCASVVSGVAIAVRVVWVLPSSQAARWLRARLAPPVTPAAPWRHTLFTGLAGIRGGDSLVIALALPLATAAGAPFPGRGVIIFLTFVVIVVTLVVLGALLGPLARALRVEADDDDATHADEARAREALAAAPEAAAERRRALLGLWERAAIGDALMRKLENELDHAEVLEAAEGHR
jgi:CPA1 family monovalent cation:H+ antiporter